MFDQILENFRKATESTLKLQQDMLQNWTKQWTAQAPTALASGSAPPLAAGWLDQVHDMTKAWTGHVTELLNKHREALDAQYKAGIRTFEEAARVGEAKDPEQFRKLVEAMWKQAFDTFKTLTETQMRDFQGAAEKWFEAISKGAHATKS